MIPPWIPLACILGCFIVLLLLTALVGICNDYRRYGFAEGYKEARKDYQIEAVKAGKAEWVLSQEGQVVFKWKEVV